MWHVTDSMRRVRTLALAVAILSPLPLAAGPRVRHVKWEDLPMVTGRTVRISLPGCDVTGKAGMVESDALWIDVRKTSNRNACPKGRLRVPREKLHSLEMQTKGKFFRVGASALAGMLVVPLGYAAGTYGVDRCDFWSSYCPHGHSAGGVLAAVGISAAGITGAYFAGNALDTRWTVIEIEP